MKAVFGQDKHTLKAKEHCHFKGCECAECHPCHPCVYRAADQIGAEKSEVGAVLARQHRPDLGLFCAYLVSGAIHAWVAWVALGAFAAFEMAVFFGLQSVFILAEDRLHVNAWPVPWARAWTLTILLATSPLIICPYLRIVHL